MLAHPAMQKQRIVRRQNSLPFGLLQCVISKEQIAMLSCSGTSSGATPVEACCSGESLLCVALR